MKAFFLILFSLSSLIIFSQKSKDSLEIELRQKVNDAANDSLKVHYLFELTKVVEKYSIDQGRDLMNQTLQLIDDIANPSFYFFEKKANLLDILGKYESKQTNYKNSLNLRLQALKIREKLQDSFEIAKSYHSISMIFRYQKEYDKSKTYFLKSIAIQERHVDSTQLARTYNMLGVIYYYTKQNDSAMHYYKLSKNYSRTLSEKAKSNDNIATIYYTTGKYEKAIALYEETIDIFKSTKDYNFLSNTLMHLAKIHSDLGKYPEALSYMDEALDYAKKQGNTSKFPIIYQLRSHIYEQMGNYKNALGFYKTHKYYYDSIFNVKNAKKITALELNYQFQKEKLSDSLQFANEKSELKLKNEAQQATNRLYITLLLLISAGIITLLIIVNNRRKLNKERFKKEQLEKELLDEKLKHTTYQAKQLVADNKMRLQFKQEFLSKLKKVKQHADAVDVSDFQSLISDLNAQISTESKFDSIGDNIEQLDEAFNQKLRTLYPDLTKSEREICALMRMNLSLKEIMVIRNVTMGSIKASRHRIRKKMGLEREQELEQVILELI
ncbi:tetratricopeptide repeat protein [Aquimarina sp. 2201CG5-10]|uniref:tetratricopeptide repeat protein n=1 Tax=Aquimarina callyspongiae TaxID=3098150 RepID=UPI002AB5A2A1|nr:tetratricopeptide repeat protein [Aquimarina sp. 2201CG5-10]MDY8138014.1 tetratricopeptide repeat protein [Aquimarina sp. 2201CG5-10]